MWQKWIPQIIVLCFLLFLSRYIYLLSNNDQVFIAFFSTDNQPYNSGDFINIGFSSFEFEQAKLRDLQLKHDYNLTGIVLYENQLETVQKTVAHLLHTQLVKQIIVWNNNPQTIITVNDLIDNQNSTIPIRVINSKENLKHIAIYHACTEATTRACFHINNQWHIFHSTKSLLVNFRSDPTVLHSITNSYAFYRNFVQSYSNLTSDLYTESLWIDSTSIFLREHAQRYFQVRNQSLKNPSGLTDMKHDLFSIWFDDILSKINTNIRSHSSSSQFSSREKKYPLRRTHILQRSRRVDQSDYNDIKFLRRQNHRFSYFMKSPSLHDEFIFYTNVIPYDMHRQSSEFSEAFNKAYLTSDSIWRAVDGDSRTCWRSHRDIQPGDFFAIDFLRAQTNLTFILTITHSTLLQQNLDISISFNGVWWITYRSLKGITTKISRITEGELQVIRFDSTHFALGFQSFRYISFKTLEHHDRRLHVCDIQIIPNNK